MAEAVSATSVEFVAQGMRESLTAYRDGRLSISGLSTELKIRLAAFNDDVDPAWIEELRTMRNGIEVVNAIYLESGRASLTAEEGAEVEALIDELSAALTPY